MCYYPLHFMLMLFWPPNCSLRLCFFLSYVCRIREESLPAVYKTGGFCPALQRSFPKQRHANDFFLVSEILFGTLPFTEEKYLCFLRKHVQTISLELVFFIRIFFFEKDILFSHSRIHFHSQVIYCKCMLLFPSTIFSFTVLH